MSIRRMIDLLSATLPHAPQDFFPEHYTDRPWSPWQQAMESRIRRLKKFKLVLNGNIYKPFLDAYAIIQPFCHHSLVMNSRILITKYHNNVIIMFK